jgi:hypothetical protein
VKGAQLFSAGIICHYRRRRIVDIAVKFGILCAGIWMPWLNPTGLLPCTPKSSLDILPVGGYTSTLFDPSEANK